MSKKKESVGKVSYDLLQKDPDTRDPIEIQREVHKQYENQILKCLHDNKKHYDSDFYIVVITKKERLMQNVLRNYFFVRESCPTPDYDQTVYRYIKSEEKIEFLWVIPDNQTCEVFRDNAIQIVDSEKWLLQFVLDFYDGTLFKICKKLNGEKEDSPLLEN